MEAEKSSANAQADGGHETLEALAGEYQAANDGPPPGGAGPSSGAAEWGGLFHALFAVAALRAGPHWVLSEEEADTLGESFDRVADKYGWNQSAGPELGLAFAVIGITAPRVMLSIAQSKQAEETDEKGKENGNAKKS